MKIGIIVAMGKELALLEPLIENRRQVALNGFTFTLGEIGSREVVAMQCGIGKVNAAIGALTMIENFHPSVIINSGVAGGTGHGASRGDVILASEIAYHDCWCGPGTEPGQAAGCPARFACPLDAEKIAAELGANAGLLASGDIFVSRPEDIQRILSMYPEAVAVDMESAAIAQVCFLKSVPMVCLRIVSDTPGAHEDNASQYENFWENAPARTFDAVRRLISII
ncbi:MAG: 5'-methylthioadenosine/adenosylhomocysteine nucleosidase [Bacteroides sp.]|nr:5'-methylthioadenosine/adenosylhomocysteine nucleosidase [Bacteroides sp.]MCM1458036.1 5'-methylthioadenosine/adenosylhomocysteine nucleosidase [Lachnoclostridium sp.]